MIKILAIAPYDGMAESLLAISKKRQDISMTVKTGNLQTGVQIAKECIHNNYDVIISRGGTAKLLRKEFDLPVLEISISVYDMLRALKLAQNYTDKFAIVGYPSITKCARTLCDLLQYEIDIFTFCEDSEVLPTLTDLKDKGYRMVLCDMIGSVTAHKIGLNSILITSGPESIENSIDEAVSLCQSYQFVYKQKELFQQMFLASDSEALLFTGDGKLTFSSLRDDEEDQKILKYIKKLLPTLLDAPVYRVEKKHNTCMLSICSKQIYHENRLYLAVYIHRKALLSYSEESFLTVQNRLNTGEEDLEGYYNSAAYVGNLRSTIEDYAKTAYPVLILGEKGTGKGKAASLIYELGLYQNSPYYVIDCCLVTDKKWTQFLEDEDSPFCNIHSTIYLKNTECLSETAAAHLITFLDGTNVCKRNRFIFSAAVSRPDVRTLLTDYLMNHLSCLTLYIPPLRDRREDIPSIITLYLNQLNTAVGKEIIGFEADALQTILDFPWKENLDQFKRVLKELVITARGSYITQDETRAVLRKESPSVPILLPGTAAVKINQPLSDINYDIACMIIEEEDGNQAKAAKRLDISRSTLWRMLKSRENS